ncbi:hypothetical protein T484DRAFT_1810831, partial [Baffinella frigidus]
MLRKIVLAAAIVSCANSASPVWEGIPVSTGDARHNVVASGKITVDGVASNIGFVTLARSGDKIGDATFATIVDNKGAAVMAQTATGAKGTAADIANNPDFTSILEVGSKLFSITQFEQGQPSVAYLSSMTQ